MSREKFSAIAKSERALRQWRIFQSRAETTKVSVYDCTEAAVGFALHYTASGYESVNPGISAYQNGNVVALISLVLCYIIIRE